MINIECMMNLNGNPKKNTKTWYNYKPINDLKKNSDPKIKNTIFNPKILITVAQPYVSSRSWRIRRCPSQLGGDTFGLLNQTHLIYVTTLLCQFLSVTAWNIPFCFSSRDPTESWRISLSLWHVTRDLIEKIRPTAEISVKFKTSSFPHSVCCRARSDWSQGGSDGWQRHCLPITKVI